MPIVYTCPFCNTIVKRYHEVYNPEPASPKRQERFKCPHCKAGLTYSNGTDSVQVYRLIPIGE